jgi:hypothetical protein
MNRETLSRKRRRFTRALFQTATAIMLLAAAGLSVAHAQTPSTDRDNPTPLASNVITGDGVDDKTEFFYSFPAGPGEVNVTLDVKAEKGTAVSSVDIALFDARSNKLLSTYENPDHGSSKRAVETAKVRGMQTLLLEVTVSLPDGQGQSSRLTVRGKSISPVVIFFTAQDAGWQQITVNHGLSKAAWFFSSCEAKTVQL